MVYTPLPVYLDPPNWNQQLLQQLQQQQALHDAGESDAAAERPSLPLPNQKRPVDQQQPVAATGSIRPGSMAERARLAKIPPPEPSLKCPRCDSTNTKFCYFNNYSLSQPRHFCKACRRYWTRGGALRNVPVGGSFRRNKRSKTGSSSKSSSSAGVHSANAKTRADSGLASAAATGVGAVAPAFPTLNQLPFLPSLHPLSDVFGDASSSMGMHYGAGMQATFPADFHVGNSSCIGLEQWRIPQSQQLPLYMGLEQSQAESLAGLLIPFSNEDSGVTDSVPLAGHLVGTLPTSAGLASQLAAVKMDECGTLPQGLHFVPKTIPRNRRKQPVMGSC